MTNSTDSSQQQQSGNQGSSSPTSNVLLNKVLPISLIVVGVVLVSAGLLGGSLFNNNSSSENTIINLPNKSDETESEDKSNPDQNEKISEQGTSNQNTSKDDNKANKDSKTSSTSTTQANGLGSAQNSSSNNTPIKDDDIVETGHTVKGLAKSAKNALEITMTGIWKATDYIQGDLNKDAQFYTVQLGDTLWEIAEAYFGSGFEWTQILNLNSSKIGFLPNGEQALIFPNQVLKLK